MKNIYSILVVIMSLFLSSCGSNSKKDPVAPVVVGAQNTSFSFSDTDNELLIETHREYSIGFKLNKDGYGFPSAIVRMRSFDAQYGTLKQEQVTTDENGRGVFVYIPPETFPSVGKSVTIQYVFVVTLDNNITQELVQNTTLKFNFKGEGEGEKSKYYFSNVDTVITVETRQKYDIKFKLNKDGFGFSGGEVKIKSFNSKYGTIENETLQTDANGIGIFIYNPPAEIPEKGVTTQIEFIFVLPSEDDKKEQISQKVTLKFNLKDDTPSGESNYYFNETVDVVNVTSYKKYAIPFKLNKDNFIESGATVKMKTFDSKFGTIEKSTVVTDENGRAQFTYNPPKNMPSKGSKHEITYVYQIILSNGDKKELAHTVTLQFNYNESENGTGRATELSISYLTTSCNKDTGLIGHYAVHAVDLNSRKPIVGQTISLSAINGIKILNSAKVQTGTGRIQNTKPISFKDSNTSYAGKVSSDDTLIVLATQGHADISYLGGWNIDDVSSLLQLHGSYTNINDTSGLTYIIGNEKRLLGGENGNAGSLSTLDVSVKEVLTDSKGYANFDINFDPRLGGHTAVVEAHGNEDGKRFGVSEIISLRVDDLNAPSVTIHNTGEKQTVPMHISIQPSCVGPTALIDVPVNIASFHANPTAHCAIVGGNFLTNSLGDVILEVQTSGITKAVDEKKGSDSCVITWNGGMESLLSEY